jgi:hypothetical protein
MRFEINANCKRGLRIIRELPDYKISRIEGYNGIGKSSALRLLELCTGSQPYHGQDRLWASFREQLVHATVRVTGLQGGAGEIAWDLDPSAWPDSPEPLGDRLGRVQIDGRPARCGDVAPLLSVHTVLANETFTDTLAGRLEAAARRLDAWTEYGSGAAWQHMEALEALLDESRKAIQAPGAAELRALRLELENAEAQSQQAALDLEWARARVEQLTEAKELAERLDDIRGRGPELSAQLADIRRQQEELNRERSALDEQIAEIGRREQGDAAARREFDLARENLERRQSELRNARRRLADAKAAAGSDAVRDQIEAEEPTLSSRLEDLTAQLPRISVSPFMARLLAEIADRLHQAEEAGLGGQVLLPRTPATAEWTVRAWREACEGEAASRTAEGSTETAQAVETEIAHVRKRLQMLAGVREEQDRAGRAAELRRRAALRLERAIAKLPSEEATTLDQLVSAREQADALLAGLADRHAAVQHALSLVGGGADEGTLRERLARICDEVGVPESRVRGQLAAGQERLAAAQDAFAASRLSEDRARRTMEEAAGAVGTALSALRQRPGLSFARRAAGDLIPLDSEAVQAVELSALGSAMERAARDARGAVDRVQGIAAALDTAARLIRGTGGPSKGARWIKPVQEWLSGQVTEWFNQADVRQALFPDGHDITVNVGEMSVSWTAADGEDQTRPLKAFSSGQQALAYTRSGMAALDTAAAGTANRLIALDEFGAFIDANAMERLSGYLLDRHEAFPRDQVVVVLALRQEIRTRPDPGDTAAADRWRQLQERGYLAERITR